MIKTLVPVGQGLGIVIDDPILDLLRIQPDTPIEVSTDGRRLILEPVRVARTPVTAVAATPLPRHATPAMDAPDLTDPTTSVWVLDALVAEHGMSNDQFRRLHHAKNYANTVTAHRRYCARPGAGRFRRGETNEQTAARLLTALHELKGGATWDIAIAKALELNPK